MKILVTGGSGYKGSILIPFSSNVHLKELIKKIKGED